MKRLKTIVMLALVAGMINCGNRGGDGLCLDDECRDGGSTVDAANINPDSGIDASIIDAALPDAGPDASLPECGNGVVETGETCDDGNTAPGDGCDADCQREPSCGDGFVDQGEECDNGTANSDTLADACRTDCTNPSCGDDVVDPVNNEECDDGNSATGDGCASCLFEVADCGNGIVELGEECDDGTANSDTDPDACRTTCIAADCGDGVLDTIEECDDGNDTIGDGCDDTCQLEPFCGDGNIDPGEECDDGIFNSDTIADACRSTCTDPICGDGVVDTGAGEECDDNNTVSGDGCDDFCMFEVAVCGNGVVELGEECDNGINNDDDAPNACRTTCVNPSCGDSVVDNNYGEVCDDSNNVDGDSCTSTCQPGTTCWSGAPNDVCETDAGENSDNCPEDCGCPTPNTQPCSISNAFGMCVGTETCMDGVWTCGAQTPAAETCDGVDNDCNGQVDDNPSETGQACTDNSREGICQPGTYLCVGGSLTCLQSTQPGTETCNNVDDNCDGAVDENLNQTCQETNAFGTCTGTETCSAGAWLSCTAAIPAAETCDNADNDCDGAIDENLSQNCYNGSAGTENVGLCTGGIEVCTTGAWGTCVGEIMPTSEVCDNADNDCDGATDENLSQACQETNTFGTCVGTETCAGGVYAGCTAVIPAAETCDNADNDCDGAIDENLSQGCYTGPAGTENVGLCHGGDQTCTTGIWGVCTGEATPMVESCDNADNDCDGLIDEDGVGNPLAQTCQEANVHGTCQGAETCSSGSWVGCTAVMPAAEVCDGIDNDCDTFTDEDLNGLPLNQTCQETNAFGTCTGTETCSAGAWLNCTAAIPAAETCDNADNDCDGAVDENLSQTCQETNGFGTCIGTETCSAGAWFNCTAVMPAAEVCDNADNDCDGAIDENLSQNCYNGPAGTENVGLCTGGIEVCTTGSWGTCVGEIMPTSEVCDGADNNCDGATDENLSQACQNDNTFGTCVGMETCAGGVYAGCTAAIPAAEMCDNADNDCDGQIDENLSQACFESNANGTCFGTETCVGGSYVGCTAQTPAVETCNNVDDNCDGQVDEFLSQTCQNANGFGTCTGMEICSAGAWGVCSAATPSQEVCNNVDDDCDGQTDENLDRQCQETNGFGTCVGSETCSAGNWVGCSAAIPAPEQCDGVDNNCDGQVDENLTRSCQVTNPNGTCIGQEICVNGAWVGCSASTPAPETCDNVDNDCSGQTDEGLSQACSVSNANGTCNGTEHCSAGAYINCSAATPAAELCNNNDDDCDGSVDENLSQSCQIVNGFGTCVGTETCTTGNWLNCSAATPSQEVCDNADNDCDGSIDEGLTQACFESNAFGTCFGTETCVTGSYVGCTAPTPAAEICGDGIDNDCDGNVDCLDSDCSAAPSCQLTEVNCSDNLDNDSDGNTDCFDSDCSAAPNCIPEANCTDSLDNDFDGNADCLDSDCFGDPACLTLTEIDCSDWIDDDGDGNVDCLDSDCLGDPDCGEVSCTDTIDNDGDGNVDCADSECATDPSCLVIDEYNYCSDGLDNDGDSFTDCVDQDCWDHGVCFMGIEDCTNGIDDDADGVVDCADPGCYGHASCPVRPEANCSDGIDNDGDGYVDCNDVDCHANAACVGTEKYVCPWSCMTAACASHESCSIYTTPCSVSPGQVCDMDPIDPKQICHPADPRKGRCSLTGICICEVIP